MKASLVMRDRETDSWWSIMTSTAIDGALEGTELDELPVGEKATWADWRQRHPDTLVLSVDGTEHHSDNYYDKYLNSDRTFGDLEISDHRLEPKTPVFSFWLNGQTYAAAHSSFEGGQLFDLPGDSTSRVFLYRDPGASIFASTRGWTLDGDQTTAADLEQLVAAAQGSGLSHLPVDGFDTFWYSWISVNEDSVLLD